MEESKGHLCPECGAPRGADNTPSCACTQRASDALRDARTAEAAAAEDFDPLRIRPYVELDGAAGAADAAQTPDVPDVPDVEATMALRPVTPDEAADGPGAAAEDATVSLPAVDATSVLPTPLAAPETTPSPTDLHLFDAAGGPGPAEADADGEEKPSRRRRGTVLLGAGGAVVSVVAAAGIASGLFSYETPSRDGAPPQDVRAAVPDTSPSAASVSPSTRTTSAAPTSASPSASASASPSPTSSPSASAADASPSPSRSAQPTQSPTSSDAGSGDESGAGRDGSPVLRLGDEGPEVTELQQRLHQLYLYNDAIDGNFTAQVEDALRNYQWSRGVGTDDLGVYDHETRAKLESETTEP
ncbi:peptidoglycan-binding domain-containing protein [Streptomyces sp. MMG1533]|uniref:peptidoglycan-binding domain-containing protein n=1 Tax=Streptomyces sp. MMG1533 TaxID=1415546 RepID=UPI0006AF20F3|nr:peptidoglycan-binding domain-containing protein [Streptomyces sp. MMG1533]